MSDQSSFFTALNTSQGLADWRDYFNTAFGAARRKTVDEVDDGDSPVTLDGTQDVVLADTSSGAVTVNLPSSPQNGDVYLIGSSSASNNVTVGRNGKTINGAASDDTISTAYEFKAYIYAPTADTWLRFTVS